MSAQLNLSLPDATREGIRSRARELGFPSVVSFVVAACEAFEPEVREDRLSAVERRVDQLERLAGL
jgi:hypothetical protein